MQQRHDDDSSIVSTSTIEGCRISEIGDVDPDEAAKKGNKVSDDNITILIFMHLDGTRTEKKLAFKLQSYTDLLREISRLTPDSQGMYMIQDECGQHIPSDDFIPRTKVTVRSLLRKAPSYNSLRDLSYNWESTEFHGARLSKERTEPEAAQMFF
jgi:hypothetical protein